MPLSDHEQRMLDQIESALYAEDPKFASTVRGGNLRPPSARRRLQGAGLFVVGLALLVAGVAFKATMVGSFPILSVIGFVVMFGGVVFAVTGPRVAEGRNAGAHVQRVAATACQRGGRLLHEPHGGSFPSSLRPIAFRRNQGQPDRLPFLFCPVWLPDRSPTVTPRRKSGRNFAAALLSAAGCPRRSPRVPTAPHDAPAVLNWAYIDISRRRHRQ